MRRLLATAIALGLAAASASAVAAEPAATPVRASSSPTTQLPTTVRPIEYAISVTPHAQELRFDGHASIAVQVLQPTDRITLNAIDMTFANVELRPENGLDRSASAVRLDPDAQQVTFEFRGALAPGLYRLDMDYTGKIGTQANGLFAIDYETSAGRKRALYTQFENSDARRFIPSWDEPGFKTPFTLDVTVPATQMAVSNMPVATRKDLGNGLARVRFQTTPKMSTYLLFFGLGDFERATDHAGDTEIGVVTQRGLVDQARWSLQASKEILPEYNAYFGTPYPLPKLDNIASPAASQFFGAMENWGAIYTFEYIMLVDPSITTKLDKHRIWQVAAHEIAHQWFGNLVTMQWWDDLWLNEGFASWMEGRTTAKLHPEWNTALEAVATREEAMAQDAVASTHPIVQHVETVEQAAQAFDDITYDKGKAVLNMLEAYVGEDAWREGVRRYMARHAYGNTVSDDLWTAIEAGGGAKLLDIAHDFTLQPGIPLLKVGAPTCQDGRSTVALEQGEFTADRPDKTPLRWRVPVIARTLDGEPASTLVREGRGELALPGCGPVLVNAGQSGYYRTLYAPAQFQALAGAFATLAPIDQLGLLGDSSALGLAGRQDASDVLELVAATPTDADTQVWGRVAGLLTQLDVYYADEAPGRAALREFARQRLNTKFAQVGWTARAGEAGTVAILRNTLIGALGTLGDPAVLAEARRRFAASVDDPSALPGALRKTVLGIVAQHADVDTWERLHAMARAETTPQVKDTLYELLAAPRDAALAQRALDLALTDEPGETNTAGMISVVAAQHPELAFDFAMAHREAIDARVDFTSRSRYYPALASGSADLATVVKVREYASQYLAEGSRRSAEQAVAKIQQHAAIRAERLPQIDAWLARHAATR